MTTNTTALENYWNYVIYFTVAQSGQTKPSEFLSRLKFSTGSLSCLEGEDEVRGVQLQHDTSPLDVTKLYTLDL